MQRRLLAAATAVLALAGAQVAEAKQRPQDRLNAYTAVVDAGGLAAIAEAGFDVAEGTRRVQGGTEVDLIMTADQRDKLAAAGVNATLTRVKGGQTVRQFAARMAANGFNVWRSYDEDGGIEDQMRAAARNNLRIAEAREARAHDPGSRHPRAPAHRGRLEGQGRQAAGGALQRHPARSRVDRDRDQPAPDVPHQQVAAGDKSIRRLLEDNELWFIVVANPDGYQYVRHRAPVAQEPARQRRQR